MASYMRERCYNTHAATATATVIITCLLIALHKAVALSRHRTSLDVVVCLTGVGGQLLSRIYAARLRKSTMSWSTST